MNTRLSRVTLLAASCVLLVVGARAEPEPIRTVKEGDGIVHTVDFYGESVGRTLRYNICLPVGYEESDERYPVLYLLHGLTSNYALWGRMGVATYAVPLDLIVVMPDAGNSWYVNWEQSAEGEKNAWEDFIIEDLIGHIDSSYRTIAERKGRAINGLSMGGFGALSLGLRHPDMFCSIGSHSGAISHARRYAERLGRAESEEPKEADDPPSPIDSESGGLAEGAGRQDGAFNTFVEGFATREERSPGGREFVTADYARSYDPYALVLEVSRETMPHIYVDCGTEDGLVRDAQAFMKVLMENKIPFTYAQSVGGHTPPYWTREVGHSMMVQYEIIRRNLKDRAIPAWNFDPNRARRRR